MAKISDLDDHIKYALYEILSLLNTATDHGLVSKAEEARQKLEQLLA